MKNWDIDFEASSAFNPVVGPDGTIYVLIHYGGFDYQVIAVDPSGNVKWEWDFGNEWVTFNDLSISRSGEIIIAGDPSFVLDQNGRLVSRLVIEGYPTIATQMVSDKEGNLYGSSSGKKVYSVNAATGNTNWTLDLRPYLPSSRSDVSDPLVGADGIIYVYSKAGTVFAISKGGKILWQHHLVPDNFDPNVSVFDDAPTMGTNGMLYIGYDDGKLHAVSTESPGLLQDQWSKEGQNPQNTRSFLCPFPVLAVPSDSATGQSTALEFAWRHVYLAEEYEVQISTGVDFSQDARSQIVVDTSLQITEFV